MILVLIVGYVIVVDVIDCVKAENVVVMEVDYFVVDIVIENVVVHVLEFVILILMSLKR